MKLFWIDHQILTEESASISRLDLGLIRGYGVFDFLRTYGKKTFYFDDHLNRLKKSANSIDLKLPFSDEEIKEAVDALIMIHPEENLGIKIYVTAGISEDAFFASSACSFWIVAAPLKSLPFDHAINLKTIDAYRELPEIKSLNYLQAALHAGRYRKLSYDDIIYKNKEGYLLESSTSNLFFIKGHTLITAEKDILHGITRSVVLDIAQGVLNIELRPLHIDELPYVDECFVTSTTKEICPVNLVDEHKMKSNDLSSMTLKLKLAFQLRTESLISI